MWVLNFLTLLHHIRPVVAGGTDPRIVGGLPAAPGQFPFVAFGAVSYIGPPVSYCGGSLITDYSGGVCISDSNCQSGEVCAVISNDGAAIGIKYCQATWIITASHCLEFGFTPELNVPNFTWGTIDRTQTSPPAVTGVCDEIHLHPAYTSFPHFGMDVALCRIPTPSPPSSATRDIIPSINLAEQLTTPGSTVTAAGWGFTMTGAEFVERYLRYVDLNIVDRTTCQAIYTAFVLDAEQMCAGGTGSNPGKDTCSGDSGGPLFVMRGNVPLLLGLTSVGVDCATLFPGVYTRVDYVSSWIKTTQWCSRAYRATKKCPAMQCFLTNATSSIPATCSGVYPDVSVVVDPPDIFGKAENSGEVCRVTTARTLTNFLGRSEEVLACLQAAFTDDAMLRFAAGLSLTPGNDGDFVMNSTLARHLRNAYKNCVTSSEQSQYLAGYFATSPGLYLSVGNSASNAYGLSKPEEQILRYYTPSLIVSSTIPIQSDFIPSNETWFTDATEDCIGTKQLCTGFTTFPAPSSTTTQRLRVSVAYPLDSIPNYFVTGLDIALTPFSTCGYSWWAILRNINNGQTLQLVAMSANAPAGLNNGIVGALVAGGKVRAVAGVTHFTTSIRMGFTTRRMWVLSAGNFWSQDWFLAIVQ